MACQKAMGAFAVFLTLYNGFLNVLYKPRTDPLYCTIKTSCEPGASIPNMGRTMLEASADRSLIHEPPSQIYLEIVSHRNQPTRHKKLHHG